MKDKDIRHVFPNHYDIDKVIAVLKDHGMNVDMYYGIESVINFKQNGEKNEHLFH